MIKTVLVAGGTHADNHYIRYCLDHFLKASWIPGDPYTRPIPALDAAIIMTTGICHDTQWKVRAAYEGKQILFASNGISSIKEELDKLIFGESKVTSILKSEDVPFRLKLAYVLGRFFVRGEGFNSKLAKPKLEKLFKMEPDFMRSNLSNCLNAWKKVGIMTKVSENAKDGLWIFEGLPDKTYDDLIKHQLFLEKDARKLKTGQVEILKPAEETPPALAAIQPAIPEPIQEMAPPIEEPKVQLALAPAPVPAAADHAAGMDLALDSLARQDARVSELTDLVRQLIKSQSAMREEMMRYHQELFMIAPELKTMDAESISRARQILALCDRNTAPTPIPRPRPMVTPATPRSLS